MFRHLRTKLTVLYAALFGLTLLVIASVVSIAVADNTTNVVNNELEANRDVFNRLWQMRADQLHDSADVLARDFGFRSAIASGDSATIGSALENLRERLNLDRAFLVENDASIVGLPHALPQRTANAVWQALDAKGDASGVLILDGTPYQAVAAPVRAPDTIGWVVFAAALNSAQMRSFEALAPIDIRAQAFTREFQRPWIGHDLANRADLPMFARLLSEHTGQAQQVDLISGRTIAIAVPLPSMTPEDRTTSTALVLSYPMALALAPYNLLLILVVGAGLVGLALVVFGSWALARSLTKPITALDDAAHRLQQGEAAHVEVSSNDEIARLAASFNAMSDGIKERERRIRHMGLFDPESQLPNRRAFEHVVAQLQANGRDVAIVAIGVNRFEHVRDAIGYGLAGELMRAFGARLTAQFGPKRVGRLSTDKFGLIVANAEAEALLARAGAIQRQIEAPLRVGDHAVDIMTTFGICPSRADITAAAQTTHASIAVGQALQAQRKVMLFDADAYGDPSQNLALISELNDAMRTGDAWLVHQPKYDVRAQKVTGVEALMRWRHPRRGMISPDLFITMAEETGHVRALTDWVLQRAIADQKTMRADGVDLAVSVNISGRLLGDSDFAERAIQSIQRAGASICFEITETALIDNAQQALATIEYCKRAGVGVSIDDYGAGLSSLSYLKQIPAQELKIDKSFVLALANSRRDALLIKSTIDLAHSLGMKVTAEGVETADVLAILSGMGCDLAQGYLIGRPLPVAELLATFRQNANARANIAESRTAEVSLRAK